jgi:SAM-dependent methyltransferase
MGEWEPAFNSLSQGPHRVERYAKQLDVWIGRLVAVWRAVRARPPGPPALSVNEIKEVAAGVRRLSEGLTRQRELAGARYFDDPKLLGAYLLFYWPISYAQARQVLGELPRMGRSALDLGSGPGPLAFAALDAGVREVTAADRSRDALQLAMKLAMEGEEALATRVWDPTRKDRLPEGKFDLISAGHLLNELFGQGPAALERREALLIEVLAALKPQGTLLLIEPALRDTSRSLLALRDRLVARGFAVRAPCLYRGPCPALERAGDWCHAERSWRMPAQVEAIARAAGLHKEALKMSYLALAPANEAWSEPPSGRVFRIVSEPLEGKGRQRYMGCGPEGRLGLALQEKHRTDSNGAFFSLQRGDVVAITETEARGDGLILNERSEVRLIAPAGKGLPSL